MKTIERKFAESGSIVGESIQMRIDPRSFGKMMTIMSRLYARPLEAIVREYATNALDSHIAAGQKLPIQVTLPTAMNPFYTVEDFGLGMDAEDIRDIYSQYGTSTKDDSDDFNGQLGLGSKSAFAVSNQFTVVGVKGGVRTEIVVTRQGSGGATMVIADQREVSEGNGVRIRIPVAKHQIDGVRAAAQKFFAAWKPGTAMVDGQDISKKPEGIRIAEGVYLQTVEYYERNAEMPDRLLMGNVVYPANFGMDLGDSFRFFAEVPIGTVEFTPSRESLEDSDWTKTGLAKLRGVIDNGLTAAVQREVDQAKTRLDAVTAMIKWTKVIESRRIEPTWQGEAIPTRIVPPMVDTDLSGDGFFYSTGRHDNTLSYTRKAKSIAIHPAMTSHLFVTGYDATKFSAPMKRKLNQWVARERPTVTIEQYALVGAGFNSPWVSDDRIVTWETIKAEKLPRDVQVSTRGGSGRPTGSYPVSDMKHGTHATDTVASDIDQTRTILYLNTTEVRESWSLNIGDMLGVLRLAAPDALVVQMPKRRIEKFLREFKDSKPREAREVLRAWRQTFKLTDDQIIAYQLDRTYGLREHMRKLKALNLPISDPRITKMMSMVDRAQSPNGLLRQFQGAGLSSYDIHKDIKGRTALQNPLNRYPLSGSTIDAHYVWYLNTAYAAGQVAK